MNKTIWMLYDTCDLAINRGFVALMQCAAENAGWKLEAVTIQELIFGISDNGQPTCKDTKGRPLPATILSRQRNARISRHFEKMGIPVYNNSTVCEICNHKPSTHLLLQGLPMMETTVLFKAEEQTPPFPHPFLVKPASGHGGQKVAVVQNEAQYREALAKIAPDDAVVQKISSEAGKDLRLYVLFGEIIGGVLRTAKSGIISNFKLGGQVVFQRPTQKEAWLGEQVIRRFRENGAPLYLAGIDLIYHHGEPVINEVEDVVGCRMLYETSSINIASLYISRLIQNHDNSENL